MPDCDAKHLISQKYSTTYGATILPCFADFAQREVNEQAVAALGYRRADREKLFLESYLERPIEQALGTLFGKEVLRRDIVEIGNLAAENALAMIGLWADAANDLGGEAEIAVAVLTAPLRSMFGRLGVTLYEIVSANSDRLGKTANQWGRYYDLDPVVCAGFITEGQERLARVMARRKCVA